VDPQVAQTLAALERKLADLERELGAISGRGDGASPEQPQQFSRWSAQPAEMPPRPPAVLVDEAVEQRFSMEARETVYGEIPATKDERRAIDLAELVRFKETMQRTLQGLIDEYTRLLSLKPPSDG
jgi:hypothetical protein